MGNILPCLGSDGRGNHCLAGRGARNFLGFSSPDTDRGRRVLVTGATGLLGRQVMRVFAEHTENNWVLRGLAFSRASGSLVRCDLFDPSQLAAQFDDFQPGIVIHCAAERRPDRLESDKEYAIRINRDVSRSVADLCKQHGAWLIYLSTNYVFDGKEAPYKEDAKPNPLSVYGESKLAGEQAVTEAHPSAAILRVPLLYGPIEKIEETSVTSLLTQIQGDAPKLDNWQQRYPTNTEDLAEVMQAMSQGYVQHGLSKPDAFAGIFHWQANECQTKYTMGVAVAEIAKMDTSKLVKVDDPPPPGSAPRPQYEEMLCDRLEDLLGIQRRSDTFRSKFKASLGRHLQPFVKADSHG